MIGSKMTRVGGQGNITENEWKRTFFFTNFISIPVAAKKSSHAHGIHWLKLKVDNVATRQKHE